MRMLSVCVYVDKVYEYVEEMCEYVARARLVLIHGSL